MAQLLIEIPDDKINRIREAFATKYSWTSELGVTKTAFTKQQVIKFIRNTVNDVEADTQAEQIRQTVKADVESINIT